MKKISNNIIMVSNKNIFIIQGAPISEEIWRWYNQGDESFNFQNYNRIAHETLPLFIQNLFKDLDPSLSASFDRDEAPINDFNSLHVNDNPKPVYDYGDSDLNNNLEHNGRTMNSINTHQIEPLRTRFIDFTAQDFITLMERFMELASGISKNPEHQLHPIQQPPRTILDFIQGKLKQALMYWCLTRGHDENVFRGLDIDMYDPVQGATNRCYHFKCYYMYKEILERFRVLDGEFRNIVFTNNTPHSTWSELTSFNCTLDEIKAFIKKVYTGDLDGFILDTIGMIQFNTITSNHIKLGQIIRLQKLNVTDFKDNSLGPYDAWRYLYPTYFDTAEDRFDDFFKAFTTHCVMFFLDNYLHNSFEIMFYPAYNLIVRSHTKRSDNIVSLLSMNHIKRHAQILYN